MVVPGDELEPGDVGIGGERIPAGVWKYSLEETPLQPALLWALMFQRYFLPFSNLPLGRLSEVELPEMLSFS